MFRNLRSYRVHSPWPETEAALDGKLRVNAFSQCGKFAERSAGWEAPTRRGDAPLARSLHGADLLQLRTQSRILPAAAVRDALEDRVADYRKRLGEEPPRRILRNLREETRDELLPQALVRSDRTMGCYLHAEKLLVIDSLNPARAEWFIDQLRPCFDAMECVPMTFNKPPEALMRRLFLGETLGGFHLGRECRLQDPSDSRATGTWRNIELDDQGIRRHVIDGMRLTHLGLVFEEHLQFVLAEDGSLSKVKLIESDAGIEVEREDALDRLDADFVLVSGAVRRLLKVLESLLGGFAGGA